MIATRESDTPPQAETSRIQERNWGTATLADFRPEATLETTWHVNYTCHRLPETVEGGAAVLYTCSIGKLSFCRGAG